MKKIWMVIFLSLSLMACQAGGDFITFETDGGNKIEAVKVSNEGKMILPVAEKEGYSFLGWFDSDELPANQITDKTLINQSQKLYAHWKINTYTIRFNTNGGSVIDQVMKTYGETISAIAEPMKAGYVFQGWFIDENLSQPFVFTTMPARDLTVYASWEEDARNGDTLSQAIHLILDYRYELFLGINKSIIFEFIPNETGNYTFQSYGIYDTYARLFIVNDDVTGDIVWDDLAQIDSQDDLGDDQNFKMIHYLTKGDIYYIQVELFFMNLESGTIGFDAKREG